MSFGQERSNVAEPVPPPSFAAEEPTRQLALAGASDHCVNCGAPLASDQRYCVNCGERRGKPRFAVAAPAEVTEQVTTTRTSAPPRRPRTSAGFNLIAGIATLLLAMGVGVLIGHNSSSNAGSRSASTPQITINGGGAGTSAAAATTPSTSGSGGTGGSSSTKSKHGGSAKSTAKAPPKVVIQKAAAAASKVTGGSAKVASPTVTQGGSCTAGSAGCQNGHFTGNNFFGQ